MLSIFQMHIILYVIFCLINVIGGGGKYFIQICQMSLSTSNSPPPHVQCFFNLPQGVCGIQMELPDILTSSDSSLSKLMSSPWIKCILLPSNFATCKMIKKIKSMISSTLTEILYEMTISDRDSTKVTPVKDMIQNKLHNINKNTERRHCFKSNIQLLELIDNWALNWMLILN